MPVPPRLLWPLKIRIAPNPADLIEFDEDFREPIQDEGELDRLARDRSFVIPAQLPYSAFDHASMKFTGDDSDTRARAVIYPKHQRRHNIVPHWHIIEIIQKRNLITLVKYKILEVKPTAQKGPFGLYLLFFEDVEKA